MRRLFSFVGFALVLNLCAEARDQSNPGTRNFAEIVEEQFSQWDVNGDGVLSKDEIEAAATNPNTKGDSAAAIATILVFARNPAHSPPPITKRFLTVSIQDDSKSRDENGGQDEADVSNGEKAPAFQRTFVFYLHKINLTSRQLFPQNLPSFEAVHQGKLGDCPFVSTVGALVYRNPAAVKAMFVEKENGSSLVNFGNGQKLNIHNLTDVDIAFWSSAGTNGLWLTVLEKAYRRKLVEIEHPNPKDRPSIYDKFGGSKLTIDILDGYKTEKIPLKKLREDNASLVFLRNKLISALDERRIVKTGTSKVKTLGVTSGHAYALLGFSKDSDSVQVWNPHGQDYKPKGLQGLENGYETKRGIFFVPLKEFVQIFDEVEIETRTRLQP